MMAPTHALISLGFTSLCLGTADPIALGIAAICSQLPDVDTETSRMGRLLPGVAKWLSRWPHRSVSHGILATAAVGVISSPLLIWGPLYWWSTVYGISFGWMADCCTKTGVRCLYPFTRKRVVFPGSPELRIETGSPAEGKLFLLMLVFTLSVLGMNLSGGAMRVFSQAIGIPSGAVAIVNAENDHYLLQAEINGLNVLTQQRFEKTCKVIRALTITDILVNCDGTVLRVGPTQNSQISPRTIRIHRGSPISSRIQQLSFFNQPIVVPSDLGEHDTLSGILRLEDAEDLVIIPSVSEFDRITLQPLGDGQAQIRLQSALPADVQILEGYDGTGEVLIRRVHVQVGGRL